MAAASATQQRVKWLIFVVLVLFLGYQLVLQAQYSMLDVRNRRHTNIAESALLGELVFQECLSSRPTTMANFIDIDADLLRCPAGSSALKLFQRIYTLNRRFGEYLLPEPLAAKVRDSWLQGNKELFKEAFNQSVTSIFNKVTHEAAQYSPLRSKRPGAIRDEQSIAKALKFAIELGESKRDGCDFCSFESYTAEDTFLRMVSTHAFTAANAFKYDRYHSLVVFKEHGAVAWGLDEFLDAMDLATKWFDKVMELSPDYEYRHLMWDLLPKASASQLHPHIQISATPSVYYGFGEHLRMCDEQYLGIHTSSYFKDLVYVHSSLGLTFRHGTATALAYLTPKKEREIFIIDDKDGKDFYTLLYFTLRVFVEEGYPAFSLGMMLPSRKDSKPSLPAIARLVDRGEPSDCRSDISAMELFAQAPANVDPFLLIKWLEKGINKRLKTVM